MTTTSAVRYDMPNAAYHAHGALSASGIKRLLPPSCPALFRYAERVEKPQYDFGHVAHKLVLGEGDEVVIVEAPDWKRPANQRIRDDAHAAGKVPILAKDYARAEAMAAKVREHPVAGRLFSDGKPEVSLFWRDEATGVECRARLDWLPDVKPGRRLVIADYKTADSVAPAAFAKAAINYSYHNSAAWYIDGVKALFGPFDEEPAFVLVAQMKSAPYLITWRQFDDDALAVARQENHAAAETFAWCLARDEWPGWEGELDLISLPPWYSR